MLNSKKIGIISVVLIIVTVAFIVYMFINPQEAQMDAKTVVLENGQKIEFSDSDFYNENLVKTAVDVPSSNKTVNITNSGAYRFSGEYTGGIVVNCDSGEVILVLENATISSEDCAINISGTQKTAIALVKDSENSIKDGQNRQDISHSGAIFSKDDLVICGEGSLRIDANFADGINGNDSFKMTGGNLTITAADEGIAVNDYAALFGGMAEITSQGDALKCENSDDASLGYMVIEGTDLIISSQKDGVWASGDLCVNKTETVINAADDALHTEAKLYLSGGKINIEGSKEGIEGKYIIVNDGEYSVVAQDDGINATGEGSMMPGMNRGGSTSEAYLTINGGTLRVKCGGDGLDSNGSAIINGGNIEVHGPENGGNSSLDSDSGFEINGGSLIAAGAAGMAESPQESSKQNSVTLYLTKTYEKGTKITLSDEEGNEILSSVAEMDFGFVCLSHSSLKTGSRYKVVVGEDVIMDESITSSVTVVGESRGGRGNFGKGRMQ